MSTLASVNRTGSTPAPDVTDPRTAHAQQLTVQAVELVAQEVSAQGDPIAAAYLRFAASIRQRFVPA